MALFNYVQWAFFDPRGGGANFQVKTDRKQSPGAPTEAGIRAAGWWRGPGGWWLSPLGRQVLPWLWREQGAAPEGQWPLLCSQNHQGGASADAGDGPRGRTYKRGAFPRAPLKRSPLIQDTRCQLDHERACRMLSKGPWSWNPTWALRCYDPCVAITANSSSASRLPCSVFSPPL